MILVPYLADLIRATLKDTPFPHPERALPLLIGTAAQESHLEYLRQLGNGPARGLWQMEPATEADHWLYLGRKPELRRAITERTGLKGPSPEALQYHLPYQILMARLHYYVRDPQALPMAGALAEQARRWKLYYNTMKGKGTVEQYTATYRRLITPHEVTLGTLGPASRN